MIYFGWLAVFLTIFVVWLQAKKKILTWPVGLIAQSIWIVRTFGSWDQMTLSCILWSLCVYGWWTWAKDENNVKESNNCRHNSSQVRPPLP